MHLSGVLLQEGGSDFLKGFWSGMGKIRHLIDNLGLSLLRTQATQSIQTYSLFLGVHFSIKQIKDSLNQDLALFDKKLMKA